MEVGVGVGGEQKPTLHVQADVRRLACAGMLVLAICCLCDGDFDSRIETQKIQNVFISFYRLTL